MFLGLPDPDSLVRGMDPDPAPDPSLFLCWADWKNAWHNRILTPNVSKTKIFYTEDDVHVAVGKLQEKYMKEIFIF